MNMMQLQAQIEETNRLLRNMSSGSGSGSNTPMGSTGSPSSESGRRPVFGNQFSVPENGHGHGQMIKVPRLPVQEMTSPEIMT